jgi:transposase
MRSLITMNEMAVSIKTRDEFDGLSMDQLKSLLRAQKAEKIAYDLLIEQLKLQILKLRKMQFGKRSEKREQQIEQLEFWVEELETVVARDTPDAELYEHAADHEKTQSEISDASVKNYVRRREFPKHLPRETHVIQPQDQACPDCGGGLTALGEDVSEMLELEPLRFKVLRYVRPKQACTGCDTIVQASAPSRPIDRGMAGPGLLARILVGKYADHLPLYRQAEIFAREGVELDRSLLSQWVGRAHALLMPLIDAVQQHVFATDILHTDDTPIPVLAPGSGKTKTGRLWTYVRDERPAAGTSAPAVWFTYSADRKGEHPQTHLQHFAGVLQADGYSGYTKVYESGRVFEAACWAHVRRKFFDLHEANQSPIAGEALDRIGALYGIEKDIRGKPAEERRIKRQAQSRPLLDAMHDWLQRTMPTLSQKSAMALAIQYALKRWDALTLYCDDGRIEIDNNAAERSLRCVALGRKNFLFAGSDRGGRSAAGLYSLIGTAKLNGYDPEAFLREILARIGDHPISRIAELLPWNLSTPDRFERKLNV